VSPCGESLSSIGHDYQRGRDPVDLAVAEFSLQSPFDRIRRFVQFSRSGRFDHGANVRSVNRGDSGVTRRSRFRWLLRVLNFNRSEPGRLKVRSNNSLWPAPLDRSPLPPPITAGKGRPRFLPRTSHLVSPSPLLPSPSRVCRSEALLRMPVMGSDRKSVV